MTIVEGVNVSAGAGEADWSLTLTPNRAAALGALVAVWVVTGALAWFMTSVLTDAKPLWLLALPFALMGTWFGLRTVFLGHNVIELSRRGFSIGNPDQPQLVQRWEEVAEFFVDRAFGSPVYQGRPVAHMRLVDGSIAGLPSNTGGNAAALVTIMENARRLALAGWPLLPESTDALLHWSGDEGGA